MEFPGAGECGARAGNGDVEVEIGDGGGGEPGEMGFYPFGGALETEFFGVPGAEDAGE